MKSYISKISLITLFSCIAILEGCNNEPTSLGEAILKTLLPKDGSWIGETNQNEDVFFDVINHGTQIASGMEITIFFSEWWGYGRATITRMAHLSINDNKFTWSGYDFYVYGNFEKSSQCTGNFSLSGNTGYPYYYSYSASGTWKADWKLNPGGLAKNIENQELTKETEKCTIEIKNDDATIKIDLHFFK